MSTFCSEDDAPLGPPTVTGAPDTIWLNVGDIDDDYTFGELGSDHGEDGVTWCPDQQYPADIRYMRADLVFDLLEHAHIALIGINASPTARSAASIHAEQRIAAFLKEHDRVKKGGV